MSIKRITSKEKKNTKESKAKKKKKNTGQACPVNQKKKKKGVKKSNVDEFIVHGNFCLKMKHNFSLHFSLHFEEKIFWWAQGKNTYVRPFIFLPSHLTKQTQKSFSPHFLSKVFHPQFSIHIISPSNKHNLKESH